MKNLYLFFTPKSKKFLRPCLIGLFFCASAFFSFAQCPDNIDFERGDFTGWKCWTGNHDTLPNGHDTITLPIFTPPIPGRHTMLSAFPGNSFDPYGYFPKNCPNGSGHSIMLGHDTIGTRSMAQGVSYTFTIPPGQNDFNLTYHYAIVVQNSGTTAHTEYQQSSFVVEVTNITDNQIIQCSSFGFHATSSIPGFRAATEDTNVKYKDWAAAAINLNNMAGKTIELFFKSSTCTPGGHWGYAYVDVNTECSSSFIGASFCPNDTAITITAPPGYKSYDWYNLTNPNLGNTQAITIKPAPSSGDSVYVHVVPYSGYGCENVLKAYLIDTLHITANAGPDKMACYGTPDILGELGKPGLVYKWSPAFALSDPNIANPVATPDTTTRYVLTVTSSGGGCVSTDTVDVHVEFLSDSVQVIGPEIYCIGQTAPPILKVFPADSIQWYRNAPLVSGQPLTYIAMPGETTTTYTATTPGFYYARKFSHTGCARNTRIITINVYPEPVANFTTTSALSQCFSGNSFTFKDNSLSPVAPPDSYLWNMGDGTTFRTKNVTYSYAAPGLYTVSLFIAAPGGCNDDTTFTVTVSGDVKSAFAVDKPMQCFKNNAFVFTNQTISTGTTQYNWDMGDGNILHSKNVNYTYTLPGSYIVKLSSVQGACASDSSFTVVVNPTPLMGFTINNAVQCFPGHQFVLTNTSTITPYSLQYTWDMGDGTQQNTPIVNYSYATAGAYKIKLTAKSDLACEDTLSKNVVIYPTPVADFTIRPVCENLQVPIINRTVNNTASTLSYLWDFGNSHTDNAKSPVYSYPKAGTYSVKLTVTTAQCPVSPNTKTLDVVIDAAPTGIVYPDKDAAFNFPEPLQARQIGTSVTWTPAVSLSNRFSFTPTFTGAVSQLYSIAIKNAAGCITVDTQLVKTHKKIQIYVPNAFTPDDNGTNERLRPVLIGFSKVNYFKIYNRWGQLLFSMNSDQPGWDGKIGGKLADTQTVVWMIEAVDIDGKVHTRQGATVLYR